MDVTCKRTQVKHSTYEPKPTLLHVFVERKLFANIVQICYSFVKNRFSRALLFTSANARKTQLKLG